MKTTNEMGIVDDESMLSKIRIISQEQCVVLELIVYNYFTEINEGYYF